MSQATATTTSKTSPQLNALALLTFKIAGQVYGLPVTDVVRIIEMVTITQLPDAPETIQGIINLQGKAVPVMDLRHRFGLPRQAYGLHTPIILADMTDEGHMLGLVVDTVEDVLNLPPEDFETTQAIIPTELAKQPAAQAAPLAGVAKINRQMMLILNVRALLSSTEQVELSQALKITSEDGRQK
jgi:purine-binding chemotaxis protein CheW